MSVEKARFNGATWVIYQHGTAGQSGSVVTASFVTTITGLSVAFDARTSTSVGGDIANLTWDFGDGPSSGYENIGYQVIHDYAVAGSYTVTLVVTDTLGTKSSVTRVLSVAAAVNQLPVIKMATPIVSGLSVTFSVQGSYDPDGTIVLTEWNFGDNTTATGPTVTHVYAAGGSWLATVKCTDDRGGYSTASVTASPVSSGGGTTNTLSNPWTTGSVTEGMAGGAPVYTAASLAGGASTLELQTLINNMPGNGYIDISNEQIYMSSFGNGTYPQAAGGSKFYGLIGGISNGAFNNQVTLRANVMTAAQVAAIQGQQTAFSTSQGAVFRRASSSNSIYALPTYFMGVHIVGADQGQVTESSTAQYSPAPARMKGLDLDVSAAGSIFQNCLLEGVGAADGAEPPWEVGSVDFRRTTGFIMRRVEVSGILPVGSPSRPNASSVDPYGRKWQRTGGIQWNADKSPVMSYVSLHDTLVSGLTASIAGTSNNGSNNSQNLQFDHLYISNNSGKGFSGINLESVIGPISFANSTFAMNGTGGYHISFVNSTDFGTLVPTTTQLTVTEPTWSGLGNNGMFTIRILKNGTNQTVNPTVIKNGKSLTPTTSTTADPANYYCIINSN